MHTLEPYSLLATIGALFIFVILYLKINNVKHKDYIEYIAASELSLGLFSLGAGCWLFAIFMISGAIKNFYKKIKTMENKNIVFGYIIYVLFILYLFIISYKTYGLYGHAIAEIYAIVFLAAYFIIKIGSKKIENNYIYRKVNYFSYILIIISYLIIADWAGRSLGQPIFSLAIILFLIEYLIGQQKILKKK